MIVEERHQLLYLSFVAYEKITNLTIPNVANLTTAEREGRYVDDQLSDRIFLVEFGTGVRKAEIRLKNPVIISQRYDEDMVKIEDFVNPDAVTKETFPFPAGPYGYSPFLPMDLRFQRPLRVQGFYLKKHRSPDFYLKNSFG